MRFTRVVLVLCCCVCYVFSKRFETRCKLVRELMKVGVPNDMFLGQWVCLIEKASNRNTSAFVVTPSGKKFYGLYKIPSVWCREKKRGGACNIKCEDLLNEDIRDDTACAVKIFQEMGFQYWPDWLQKCKNNDFITNEIYKCPDLRFSPDRSASRSSSRSKRSPKEDLFTRLKRSLGLKVKNDVCYGKCCS
ncbi:lysozyme-like isoform X1 [Anticarsia gemmatalis]|uniref:lysozyme-like isoform X1 n=1 Tax=Anticarsia gemmatalis TaxID=129554 RepID=UPI003F774C45